MTIADHLRQIAGSDIWRIPTADEPELAQALRWAQSRLMDAADALDRAPRGAQSVSRPSSKAAREAQYALDRAKRMRESHHADRPEGRKARPAHLYRGS